MSGGVVLLVNDGADLYRFCMLHSGLMILEANLNYRIGSSFDTITKDLLGKGWNVVNGISIAFVLYILTYAYISASGSILHHTFAEMSLNVPARAAGFGFALLVAFVVWLSTKAVSRMTAIVLGGESHYFLPHLRQPAGGMYSLRHCSTSPKAMRLMRRIC